MKTIRDAVHGDMRFDDLEMSVIDTPPVQRLRGIKQLGMSCLVFPSAVHTRFEHSLGTCWLTKRILDSLRRDGAGIDPRHDRAIRLAALLHDVTHVPFGHTIEDERRLFPRHDEDPARLAACMGHPILAAALRAADSTDDVQALLRGTTAVPAFARQIVTGTVCADLLDYLRRDALFCGLSLSYDERLFDCFAIVENRLVVRLHKRGDFRRDALSELVALLQIRYALTERVYYHHAKVVAGAMVSRILELALAHGEIRREELTDLRDDGLFAVLRERTHRDSSLAELLEDLNARRLFKRVYSLGLSAFGRPGVDGDVQETLSRRFHEDLAARKEAEEAIAADLGIPAEHVIVYCPSPKMSLKEADVPVEVEPGKVVALSSLGHPDVDALRAKHRGLWRLVVCIRQDHADRLRAAGKSCENVIGYANQLEPLRRGRLAFSGG